MPLNDDPDAMSDEEYAALIEDARTRAIAQGEPPCRMAVPEGVLVEALARLDGAQ